MSVVLSVLAVYNVNTLYFNAPSFPEKSAKTGRCVKMEEKKIFYILYVLTIKLTKKTRRRVGEGWIRNGDIRDGEIREVGCEGIILCLSQI